MDHSRQESGPNLRELLKDPLNRRQAIAQGWRPPPDERIEETQQRLEAQTSVPVVPMEPIIGAAGGLYVNSEAGAADKRRRAADKALEQAGIIKQRRPWC